MSEMIDTKEYARQMRENAVKNEQGIILCSPELWEQIASIIERAIVPPCKVGDIINGEIVESVEYGEHLRLDGTKYINSKIYTRDPEEKRRVYCSHPISWERAEQALKENK